MESKVIRSPSSSPTDLSLCKRKPALNNINNNNNNNNGQKRLRLSAENARDPAAVDAVEERAFKPVASSSGGGHVDPSKLVMPDQNTASMLAAMAFRARSSFMIGDILNSSRWDQASHPLLGAYHHAALMAAANPHQFAGFAPPADHQNGGKSEDESEVDVESNASYNSQNSSESIAFFRSFRSAPARTNWEKRKSALGLRLTNKTHSRGAH